MSYSAKRVGLSFWPLQLGSWLIYIVNVTLTAIPVRHAHDLIAYRSTFIASAFLSSFVMYALCHALWHRKGDLRICALSCLTVSLLMGIFCSALATWGEIHWGQISMAFRWESVVAGSSGSSFVLATWCTCYFSIKHYQLLQSQRVQLAESALHAREAQLRVLRYQLHPHFLFNTLNAISTVILEGESQSASKMIAKLGNLLRTTIEHPESDSISLAAELELVKEYVSLEQFRFGDRLTATFHLEPDIMEMMVPRLFLQPVIENAIRHGIAKRSEGGMIVIRTVLQGPSVLITVENDMSFEENSSFRTQLDEGLGVGLENTSARLRQYYGEECAMLKASSRQDGIFEVIISIPLIDGNHTPLAPREKMLHV
jgi:hypothetical protein